MHQRDIQSARDPDETQDGKVPLTQLNLADIPKTQPCSCGERGLGESQLLSILPDRCSQPPQRGLVAVRSQRGSRLGSPPSPASLWWREERRVWEAQAERGCLPAQGGQQQGYPGPTQGGAAAGQKYCACRVRSGSCTCHHACPFWRPGFPGTDGVACGTVARPSQAPVTWYCAGVMDSLLSRGLSPLHP